jgi:hypothetical protein
MEALDLTVEYDVRSRSPNSPSPTLHVFESQIAFSGQPLCRLIDDVADGGF